MAADDRATDTRPSQPRLGRHGELLPIRGFSRRKIATPRRSAWVSHDGLIVISGLENADLPGSGNPPTPGPQWLISVSLPRPGSKERCNVTDEHLARVVDCFAMPAYDEDNHHPGIARHLWCPVDPAYQQACECKVTEISIVEPSGYTWTTEDGACRGCEYQQMFGLPCTVHDALRAGPR